MSEKKLLDSEYVARAIFLLAMLDSNGNVSLAAFSLRHNEDYFSVARMAVKGWLDDIRRIPTSTTRQLGGYCKMGVGDIRGLGFDYDEKNKVAQIVALFQKAKSTISFHISNIFKEGELDEKVVVRKNRTTTLHGAIDGKKQTHEDETVLTQLDKRTDGVTATIYTQHVSQQLQLDIDRHNAQYSPIIVEHFNRAHDRFLLIDDEVYHIGASLKDLGKKWFAFTLMRDLTAPELISRISSSATV